MSYSSVVTRCLGRHPFTCKTTFIFNLVIEGSVVCYKPGIQLVGLIDISRKFSGQASLISEMCGSVS
jgi:hypothetical protein